MAIIIPRQSGAEIESVAERRFLDAAEKFLDDDFLVFHSVPWVNVQTQQLQQGECDFLILHHQLGIITIEAKPGDLHYEGKFGLWMRENGQTLKTDPFLQAQKSSHTIAELLRQKVSGWKSHAFPSSYAVYFCGADRVTGILPPHADSRIMLMEPDLPRLQLRLTNIACKAKRKLPPPSADLIRKAIRYLRPEFQLIQAFSTKLGMLEQELHRLTQQQILVLDSLQENRRLLIKGCAGSGKTLLALEKSHRLARAGKRVLLLCYNIPLANWLRSRIDAEALDVDVFHFHALCEHYAILSNISFEVPTEPELRAEFFDVTAPALLEQAIRNGVGRRYDAIIVDEGQDFVADWWLAIEELLAEPGKGRLSIFYDPDQNIFGRRFEFLTDGAHYLLNKNCRNSPQIAAFVNRCVGKEHQVAEFALDGPSPVEYEVDSEQAELEKVASIVDELVRRKKISPDRIVLLGFRRKVNSVFAEVTSLAGIPLIDESTGEDYQGKIRYATIYRFKGLESDCVILTGATKSDSREMKCKLYCAASRARFLLYVLYQNTRRESELAF